ncbi:furin (paired basic amino acid cleaving enzyme) a [Rhincodon typus]|uniref:furin (paired basic amino acid cleaving enzyme) a n=1 Tax=Rhincodon typus TaxID=259920 RepID=UPI00202E7F8D|nr:furin (paired basic amino acid cleaving enzyme) a [Rhincodon typus]
MEWGLKAVLSSWTLIALCASYTAPPKVYSNTWAVRIPGGQQEAARVAREHGFINLGQIFDDYYHFRHNGVTKRSLNQHAHHQNKLLQDPQVKWLEQQVIKKRKKRDIYIEPNDPKFPLQWYLHNMNHHDLNVKEAWKQGYTGKGVVVSILDDGIEKNHPDLSANYDPGASYDVNNNDPDPQPRYTQLNDNRHGTRCAGEVAAVANNGICGVGVAYNARIGGVRMLDGEVTDAVEAQSLSMYPQHIDIYSASWGPEDDGKTVDGPAKLAQAAFFKGISQGRGRLGSIFVWASGNGGREHDSCNCDGYTNSIYTLSISSTTQSGNVPWYSEACSSTLATTYSSGGQFEKQIVTTDLRQKCTESHTGTSASAPLAAGIIALALEANKNLTWRDMQHLVVRTSKPSHLSTNDWIINGVGRKVSHSYGYGLLDAGAMVALAKNWTSLGDQRKCVIVITSEPKDIGNRLEVRKRVDACLGTSNFIRSLEHVQARITLSYNRRGDLAIFLTSPMGTRSTLLAPRQHDYSSEGFTDWAFMTTHSWDENPSGEWVLELENTSGANNYGTLRQFTLVLYGTAPTNNSQQKSTNITLPAKCKTLNSQQVCAECEGVYFLHQQSCVEKCPPGFYKGFVDSLLDNNVEPSQVLACLPCHASCRTCNGFTANRCLSCLPHSHYNEMDFSCSPQMQVSRESPLENEEVVEPLTESQVPIWFAFTICAFIIMVFFIIFIVLQVRSGFQFSKVKVYTLQNGKGIISYKGISDVWKDGDLSESDCEEFDVEGQSERTAFIKKIQSVL